VHDRGPLCKALCVQCAVSCMGLGVEVSGGNKVPALRRSGWGPLAVGVLWRASGPLWFHEGVASPIRQAADYWCLLGGRSKGDNRCMWGGHVTLPCGAWRHWSAVSAAWLLWLHELTAVRRTDCCATNAAAAVAVL
jgi:hypothetical protein